VQYLPPGGEAHVCAAIWREGERVHVASPLLRVHNGVRDPEPYVRQFPDALGSIDAFAETMTWLDAACYAATDPSEVETACEQHPEWRLRCVPYDGGDASLLGLASLIRAAGKVGPLPQPIMRDCLLEIVAQILKGDPELFLAQIEATFHEGDGVATLELGLDRLVLVTLRANVASSSLVRETLLAHRRMIDQHKGWAQCLLVLPDLEIGQPMVMTSRVVITNMESETIRAALVRMAKR